MYKSPGMKIGTLNSILATREKIRFPHRINLAGAEHYKEMCEWCDTNCKGVWKGNYGFIVFFQFVESSDALMFSLRWGNS